MAMAVRRSYLIVFAFLLVSVLPAAVMAQVGTPTGPSGILLDGAGRPTPRSALLSRLATDEFVFVGEKHDNAEHHGIEAHLIARRLDARPGSAVVFEMLDDAQREAVTRLAPGADLETIKSGLQLPAKGWSFDVYGPLFKLALDRGRLVPGNIGKAFIGQVYGQGEAAMAGDERFATAAGTSETVRTHLLERIYEAHCGMQDRASLAPMLSIQLAKDASMAQALVANTPSLLIAGGEHVRRDTGVPDHVVRRDATGTRLVIQLLEADGDATDIAAMIAAAGPADFYWVTPATAAKDYCAGVTGRAAGKKQ